MFHKDRQSKRKLTYHKAKHRERVARQLGDCWHYEHLGQYRKGKIHCSCPMCAAKTNAGINRSRGPVDGSRHCRCSVTNHRFGKKNYRAADLRQVIGMRQELDEYVLN